LNRLWAAASPNGTISNNPLASISARGTAASGNAVYRIVSTANATQAGTPCFKLLK
jgi:hypothetical protein